MGQRVSHIKDKIGSRKGGRKLATQPKLIEGPSTVNDPSQSPETPSNVAPRSSAQVADSEILPIPTSPSQPVPESPPIQAQLEQRDEQTSNTSKLPKPYATNFDLWNEASSHPDGPGKYCDIKNLMGEPDRNSNDVKGLAGVIKEKLDETFKAQEHDSSARRVIENAVVVLSKFTSAVDVAVSFDPVHAALPWAAVRSVLIFVTSSIELQSQVLAGIAAVVSLLAQCDTYQQLYMAPDPDLRPPETALYELKTAIVETFAKSQSFLSFAVQQQQSKIRQVAAPFKLSDAKSHIKELSKCEKQLARVAANCEKYCNLASRSNVEGFIKLNATIHETIQSQIASVLDRIEYDNQMTMLDWISSVPYGKHHNRVKDDRTPATCEWLLSHEKFYEWENSSSSMILWLQGSPGAGKTFLTSKVVDHIQAQVERSPNQEGFAFFYCNRDEEERRKPLCVLQSYVRQLSTTIKNPRCIRKQLQDFCRETRSKGSDFGFSDCKKQLLESINLYSQTTVVLDALDECEPDSRRQIFETVKYLLTESENPLKVFISSRPDRDIRREFLRQPSVEIQATDNEEDIQKFVNAEIIKHDNWKGMSLDLQKTIVEVLFTRSRGMFQWAFLQIKEILLLETETAVRDRLGKLPADLKTAYDEIYSKIQNGHRHERSLADNAFKWVACAKEPLSSEELLAAIRLNSDKDTFDLSDAITESQLLHLCNNLLVLDSQQYVWRFSHLSVTEYFEQHHWTLAKAHCHAASVCLKFLIQVYINPETDKHYSDRNGPNESDSTDTDIDSNEDIDNNEDINNNEDTDKSDLEILNWRHPVQKYARMYWITHSQSQEGQEPGSTLRCLLKSFLGSPLQSSLQYRAWVRVTDNEESDIPTYDLHSEAVALFAMCRFGFYTLLKDWWDDAEFDITLTNSVGCSLLGLAAMGGYNQICDNLIRRGADVNMQLQYGDYGSALAAAVYGGELEVVQLLIDNGADVNMQLQCGDYGSALAAAVTTSNGEEVIRLLIDKGADVNMQLQHGHYGSALAAAAAASEKKGVVKLLICRGADVDMQLQCGDYGSALIAAIAHGKTQTIKFLVLDAKADVNQQVQHGNYGTALAAATFWGVRKHVDILIQAGAEVNLKVENGSFRSALEASRGTLPVNVIFPGWEEGDEWNEVYETYELQARKRIEKGRAQVVELLRLHGATDEV
ncbi:hypothetical protein F4679DRAFT_552833 [Xylaria curta]|nr:hypothetical protein F4679DRAFT_552833 [Xylaria curta]